VEHNPHHGARFLVAGCWFLVEFHEPTLFSFNTTPSRQRNSCCPPPVVFWFLVSGQSPKATVMLVQRDAFA